MTELKIYNENHILEKTIICPDLIRVYCITDKLFNSDAGIEVLYDAEIYSPVWNFRVHHVIVSDENSNILFDASDRIGARISKIMSGNYKLIVHSFNNNYYGYGDTSNGDTMVTAPYSFDVYGISGTLSTEQEQQYFKNNMIAFPVPTGDTLNIANTMDPGQHSNMEVFDSSGKKIPDQEVNGDGNTLSFDVSSLSSGVYIYKLKRKIREIY